MNRLTRDEKRLIKAAISKAEYELELAVGTKIRLERETFIQHNVYNKDLPEKDQARLMGATVDIAHFEEVIAELKERLRGR